MSRMPDGFVDLTVTSPPYDNLRDYNGYSFDFESIAKELFRVTKKGGVVVWVVGDATINGSETGTSFRQALYFKEIGLNLHDTMIYEKHSQFPDSNRYYKEFEYMFVFSSGPPATVNLIQDRRNKKGGQKIIKYQREKNGEMVKSSSTAKGYTYKDFGVRGNVWFYDTGYNLSSKDKIAFNHPASFPEKLAADHIKSWSNEGDIVYDPFMGSGTTAKMAHLLKRKWIGSEISQEYVDLANKRLFQYVNQKQLF